MITSLLVKKGVRRIVVCPGSRNAPLVRNFSECPDIECTPVTDERSAGFYALGMALATEKPVAVCVTSGSALLNVAPAVSEAYYRGVPLVVISADRPQEWIDRMDGQTIKQTGALHNIVKGSCSVCDYKRDDFTKHEFASLQLNMTFNKALSGYKGPIHINVHLDEPLFDFTEDTLPDAKDIKVVGMGSVVGKDVQEIIHRFITAERRMIVVGQLAVHDKEVDRLLRELGKYFIVINEPLAADNSVPIDIVIDSHGKSMVRMTVDFILSLGGTFVSKSFRKFLRSCSVAEHWEVNCDATLHDTFSCQTGAVCSEVKPFLKALLLIAETEKYDASAERMAFEEVWHDALTATENDIEEYIPPFSQMMAVRKFELSLDDMEYDFQVHYANSMEVRLACLYAQHYVWCNRGVNGIEGSMSTAAGFSLASDDMVFCVTGDLSFFYDQNALWNARLGGNLRVLLLNNGGGGIFDMLKGLDNRNDSIAYIAGNHRTDAHGICEQNDVGYLSAHNEEEYRMALVRFLTEKTSRPMVLEVFTNRQTDCLAMENMKRFIENNY